MSQEESLGLVAKLSSLLGASEPAFRLLLTILAGYPLALLHRKVISGQPPCVKHLFFILGGFALGYWNYGLDFLHCVFAVVTTYLILLILGATSISIILVFSFNLTHLLFGYYTAGTDTYDINWTMPHCILVLRLIGVAFDFYDGAQPPESLGADNKKCALSRLPSLLEMLGHALFPASFMIGPQFPMRRYQQFVGGEFEGAEPDKAAIWRFTQGVAYLVIFEILGLFVSDQLMYSDEFKEVGYIKRLLMMGLWGRYTLYKYIFCWLLTEGACILFGLAYNGKDESGEVKWDGLANVDLLTFENTTEFNHYIMSFNINTNHWSAQYIYKRLKFLGNRYISQLATLLFLAIWHGFHTGYFVCFFFEFVVIYMERDIKSLVKSNDTLRLFFANSTVSLAVNILLRLYTFIFMGWCLFPFALLTADRYWAAFSGVNHIGSLLFLLWPIIYSPMLKMIFKKTKKEQID